MPDVRRGPAPLIFKDLFDIAADADALPWQPFRPGVRIVQLYGEPHRGPSAALLRYDPGAHIPYHVHTGYEHILILWRDQRDESGLSRAGTLVINPPGSAHSVVSERGTIVLAIWEKPVAFPPAAPSVE